MESTRIRRECHHITFCISLIYRLFQPFLGIILLSWLPAVFYGCADTSEISVPAPRLCRTKVSLTDPYQDVGSLDIFVFRDDRLQKLDCYQRFDRMEDWTGSIVSGHGGRIVTALANFPYSRNDWAPVNSRTYLNGTVIRLEDECPESPMMSGEARMTAGEEGSSAEQDLKLRPFMSEVVLNSISCDFSGKAYAGAEITGMRVYLTNVNAECAVSEDGETVPRRIVNAGRLREEDVLGFRRKEMIVRDITENIGSREFHPGISLRCYQSNHPKESPGTPYTRLVIEGRISGHTYYWPISINRDTGYEAGIWRNRRYIYDIRITGKGTDNPDTPVKSEDISINLNVRKWKEKEEYSISF